MKKFNEFINENNEGEFEPFSNIWDADEYLTTRSNVPSKIVDRWYDVTGLFISIGNQDAEGSLSKVLPEDMGVLLRIANLLKRQAIAEKSKETLKKYNT